MTLKRRNFLLKTFFSLKGMLRRQKSQEWHPSAAPVAARTYCINGETRAEIHNRPQVLGRDVLTAFKSQE